jgi:GGDEF domain-containing protein
MLLDLDNFKPLNDAHRHVAGDWLPIEVARRIGSLIRKVGTIARKIWGGHFSSIMTLRKRMFGVYELSE